ncbi:SsgA family sporulation/cell division regulator [Actinacidiphila glaucinigra]|uniref:Streptomyces sporulation and cell division protein, SsgA n=1 Tax=Actinacidiphila glaucinigra TaxID=235986 RepID=A0A239NDU8_9ACTN|nr:SsgA family sporulation/cell division regulator [Actinacidiphila glaucinigra]SNT52673.1 Streptomyces sporulation and cell division protein, SsgA [Actinacidiphila glaucinigra]
MPYQQPHFPTRKPSVRRMRSLRLRADRILSPSFRIPHEAEFRYDETDPLVVSLALHTPEGSVVHWTVSRDVLLEGTAEPSGIGDVRVWPSRVRARRVVLLKLEVQDMSSLFEMDLAQLQKWLEKTFQLVPHGAEFDHIDWTTALAALIREN